MDINDLIIKYGIGLGRRFKRKEKAIFCNEVGKDFQQLGYDVRATIGKRKGKKSMNVMVGNVSKAKTIFIANYDTPAHNFGNPINYFPMDGQATFSSKLLPTYTPTILAGVLITFILLTVGKRINFQDQFLFSAVIVLLLLVISAFTAIMTMGVGNKVNLNRNSSGIITLLQIAEKMPTKLRDEVAFVLTDDGCEQHSGDYMMIEALPNTLKDRNIILVDCVGWGPRLGIGYRPKAHQLAEQLNDVFQGEKVMMQLCEKDHLKFSSLSFYEKGIVVCRGKKANESLIVANTASNKDDQIEAELIEKLSEQLVQFAKLVAK